MKANRPLLLLLLAASLTAQERRPRARDIGITVGSFPPGPLNAITDVPGVRVGQTTIFGGDSINTGITAILPHGGNPFREKVPAAIVVGNGFGKLAGSTQVNELGELESPIVLTCTLCVPRAADAVLTWLLALPGNEDVRSANPVVGETNDGFLNNIRARPITEADVLSAIRSASEGPVAEGAVGAGRGTVAFGWKGGIGTSSRKLPTQFGGWTVGLARTGSSMSNGSGDYVIAFSTVRPRPPSTNLDRLTDTVVIVRNDIMSGLFQATIDATEEAIYNSLLRAETVRGYRGVVRALPVDSTMMILRRHGAIPR